MIQLTPYEERMLRGEFGTAKQVALQKIIDYAQILGAKNWCPLPRLICAAAPLASPLTSLTGIWTALTS